MTDEQMMEAEADELNEQEIAIQGCFEDALQAGRSEDDIKLAMIAGGATFKNVTRLYNKFMIDAGLAISKADRDAAVAGIVGDAGLLVDEEVFASCVSEILEQVKGSTERSAGAMLRSYAKANGVELPKKAKSEGTRQSGFRFKFYAALRANPAMTEAEADAFSLDTANGASENDVRQFSHYQAIRQLVNDVSSK